MLLLLEALAQLVQLRLRELRAVERKQLGVFPGGVRGVHAAEAVHRGHDRAALLGGRRPHLGVPDDRVGQLAARRVLDADHLGQSPSFPAFSSLGRTNSSSSFS